MLRIYYPRGRDQCWQWIFDVIFNDWLGVSYRLFPHDESDYVRIEMDGRVLSIKSVFLCLAQEKWLKPTSLPSSTLLEWELPRCLKSTGRPSRKIPLIFGEGFINFDDIGNAELGIDIFGAAFFMLSRYEELVFKNSDQHDRYIGSLSFAYKANIIDRPIVDEYIEILWSAMTSVWPAISKKNQASRIIVSCDVDEPYERWIKSSWDAAKGVAGALVKRRSFPIAWRRIKNAFFSKAGNYAFDPNWNFDWYMDLCDFYGHKAYFYFIATPGKTVVDAAYSLDEPRILSLLKEIDRRGHFIGLHGSYYTYKNADLLKKERELLKKACETAGVLQEITHCRQHFLRWRAEITPDYLDRAGFSFDSSGGYSDIAGFRFGSAKEFRMWSWIENSPLTIKQSPLIMMEGSVIASSNMGYGLTLAASDVMDKLKVNALEYGGNFVCLWHNSSLHSREEKEMFKKIISK